MSFFTDCVCHPGWWYIVHGAVIGCATSLVSGLIWRKIRP